jgi:hypothetical protein
MSDLGAAGPTEEFRQGTLSAAQRHRVLPSQRYPRQDGRVSRAVDSFNKVQDPCIQQDIQDSLQTGHL